MSKIINERAPKSNFFGLPELASRTTDWHIPPLLKRMLPRLLVDSLREFRLTGRFVTPNLPREIELEPLSDDVQASKSISVIVPIHDAPNVTRRCLASLEKCATKSEIILVDDASKLPETLELIGDFSSRNEWKVVRHANALGHSEACRAGAKVATRQYLCLLNSDTVVTPACWRRAKEVFENDQRIGVAGPSTSNANRQTLAQAADQILSWNDNQIWAFSKHLLAHCREPVLVDVDWISGFALFISRSLWDEVGGFDPKLPDYGNEVDLCSRVANKGYRIVWIRNAYIHHFGEQSYKVSIGYEGILARIRAGEIYNKQKHRSSAL
jgi:GT2 family glycosyltransferase